jgi:hypothetical protein
VSCHSRGLGRGLADVWHMVLGEIEFAERVPGWVAMKDGYVTGDKIEEGK